MKTFTNFEPGWDNRLSTPEIKCTFFKEQGVLDVLLQRPPFNLLGIGLLTSLRSVFESAGSEDSPVRVLKIKSGLKDCFSMGLDPHELLPLDAVGRATHFTALAELNIAALECGRPIVALVNGAAMAGGAVLIALADVRLFHAQSGKFCFSESKVNLPVPLFVQSLVHRAALPQFHFDILVLAKNFDAQSALKSGFAHALFQTEEEAEAQFQDIASKTFRLNPKILATTLRETNSQTASRTRDFLKAPGPFVEFLGDDFFGKGLKAALASLLKSQ